MDLLAQDRTGLELEILVVDGESTDHTVEIVTQIAQRHCQVRLLHNPKRLSSAARNVGILHSTGRYVLIVDGHCEMPNTQVLRNVVRAFETSGADCLGRPQPLDVSNATTLQKAIAVARASRLGHHPESFIYADRPSFVPAKSVAVAYRREVFERVGYFDERFDAHEDGEFNYRCDAAGLRCYFTPDIAVKYFPRSNLRGLYRQMVRYGRGRIRFSKKHPGTWGLGALIPALFVLYLCLGLAAAVTTPVIAFGYLAGLSFYAAVLGGYSLVLAARHRQVSFLVWLPLVFFTIHAAAGIGLWSEWIMRESSSRGCDVSSAPGRAAG